MTPAEMAALHAACFATPRPWSEAEFGALAADPAILLETARTALAVIRLAGPEAELLTLCTHPDARNSGQARDLLRRAEARAAARGAEEIFLEVAADNAPARAVYAAMGYGCAGRRKDYYRAPDGTRISALCLRKPLQPAAL